MPTLSARAEQAVEWLSAHRQRLRRYGLIAAILIFGAGLVWAGTSVPDLGPRMSYPPLLLLLLIGAPVATILSSVELYAVSRLGKGAMPWRTALEVTVYSNAANILPLPGGALTKIVAMKAHGVGYGRGASMIVLTYAIWGGLALLYSAGAMFFLGHTALAAGVAAVGLALLLVCGLGYVRAANWRLVALIALMRLISFPIEAVRYALAMLVVGATLGFAQASIFVMASFIGSTAMVVPLGLGVSETVTALLSPLVAVEPAIGFIAAAIGRVSWMTGLLLTAGAVLLLTGRKGAVSQSGSA